MPELLTLRKNKQTLSVKDFDEKIQLTTAKWANSQIKASGSSCSIVGVEKIPCDIPILFVSNHQSNFDIPFLMAKIPTPKGFVSKTEMLKIPFIRDWMKYMNCIFLDRNDIKASAKTIFEGIDNLKNGKSLLIFPEGTRSKSNILGEFKSGSFKLATKSGATIVPITLNNTYAIMEANGDKIKPANVEIIVHDAIITKELSKEEQAKLPDTVRDIIKSGLDTLVKVK